MIINNNCDNFVGQFEIICLTRSTCGTGFGRINIFGSGIINIIHSDPGSEQVGTGTGKWRFFRFRIRIYQNKKSNPSEWKVCSRFMYITDICAQSRFTVALWLSTVYTPPPWCRRWPRRWWWAGSPCRYVLQLSCCWSCCPPRCWWWWPQHWAGRPGGPGPGRCGQP